MDVLHRMDCSMMAPVTISYDCLLCIGILELEPSMVWNPQVVAGIGTVADPAQLHKDMHAYLAGGPLTPPKAEGYLVVNLLKQQIDVVTVLPVQQHDVLLVKASSWCAPGQTFVNQLEHLWMLCSSAVSLQCLSVK